MSICQKKLVSGLLLTLSLVSTASFARWPVFTVPNIEILRSAGLLDTATCGSGKARLLKEASINILKNDCSTFCPGDWEWISNSDGECHDIKTDFNVMDYTVQHFPDSEGTSYSIVSAIFGNRDTKKEAFRLTFTTKIHDHWYCYVMNPELGLVTCANDI